MSSSDRLPLRDLITLILLVLMSFFLMCDLFITPAIVPQLAAEYNVPEMSIGYVGSAFVLVGAIISVYFGYLTDRVSRKRLLVLTVLVGEIPCLLTGIPYFTGTYEGFLTMRVLTGIGIGGIYPLTFALISDYFSDKWRATASAVVDVAWGLGTMVGPLLATLALDSEYGWRGAFILAAVPNFPIALIFAFYARDVHRGQSESALAKVWDESAEQNGDQAGEYKIKVADFKLIFQNKTNLILFLQGIPGCIPWGLLPFWLITFYTQSLKLSRGDATMIWELFGIGTAVGGLTWAILGDRLFARNPRYLPLFCSLGVFAGTIPCLVILNLPLSMGLYLLLAVFSGILISVPSSNNKALLMNVNLPEHRGSVFAVFNLTDSLGKGIGPALGSLILAMGGGYLLMVNIAVSFWLLCGLIFLGAIFTVTRDRENMLATLAARARTGERAVDADLKATAPTPERFTSPV